MPEFKTSHWTILLLFLTRIKSIVLLDVAVTLVGLEIISIKLNESANSPNLQSKGFFLLSNQH